MIGEKIKSLREMNNLSQNELATQLGLARPTITKYERDERQPDLETLCKIADFFSVSIDYLLERHSNVIEDLLKTLKESHPYLNEEECTLIKKASRAICEKSQTPLFMRINTALFSEKND